jgi:hypothetical protein
MVEPGLTTREAVARVRIPTIALKRSVHPLGSSGSPHLPLRRVRLVAYDRTAEGAGGAADRGSRARVVVDLVADDRASARTERAADERALFTAAEWPGGASNNEYR